MSIWLSSTMYDHAGDVYRCPGGKVITTTGALVNDGATMHYMASKRDCDGCALKSRRPKQASRRVPRSIYEGARDMAREIARSVVEQPRSEYYPSVQGSCFSDH
jgi:hypothetical protein